MEHHVGIDVSLELSSLCVLDAAGKVMRETKVASKPGALVAFVNAGPKLSHRWCGSPVEN